MATYTNQLVVYQSGSIKKTAADDVIEFEGSFSIEDGAYDLDIKSHDGTNGLKLDGTLVTASAAEMNYLSGVTLGTSAASKALTADASNNVGLGGNLIITGDLTVNGDTTTVSTTNTVVADKLLELGNGTTGAPSGDAGIIIERGDSDNAIIAWDESADVFTLGTTTATGASTGDLTITAAGLSISQLTLGGTVISSTAAELNILDDASVTTAEINILDGDTAATAISVVDADRFILNDDGTMIQIQASVLKSYINSNVTASSIAADDIAAGDAAVTIETTSGNVSIKDFGQGSTQLEILGANSQDFASGNIVTIASGASGGLTLADKDSDFIWPAGVAIEASLNSARSGSAANIDVVTVHGSKVSVSLPSSNIDLGGVLYLGDAGEATATAPTAGQVWRLGFSTEDHSVDAVTSCEIIWMPQFIADLG
jgi:hypothetical protein